MDHPIHARRAIALLVAAGWFIAAAQAGLIHRFSFNDGVAKDSVGNITGNLKGAGASITGGQLVLKNADDATGDKISCLEFSAPLLPKSGNSTSLVVWFTAKDIGGYARVINFGDSDSGEGKQFIYFSPRTADDQARFAITGSDVGSKTYIDADRLDDGKPHMAAIVVDGAAKKLRVYVDGKETKPAEDLLDNTLDKVKPVENWLGKSSFSADPGFTGSIDELRVYDQALTADEAAAAFKAGPDMLPPSAETKTTASNGTSTSSATPAAAPATAKTANPPVTPPATSAVSPQK